MISFNQFIKEDLVKKYDDFMEPEDKSKAKYIHNTPYEQKRFASPVDFISSVLFAEEENFFLPLYGSIIERIEEKLKDKAPVRKNVRAFHSTLLDNYDDLKIIGQERKSISVSTQIKANKLPWFFSEGVTGDGVAAGFVLRGDLVSHFPHDAFTDVDKGGKRWINVYGHIDIRKSEDHKEVHEVVQQMKKEVRSYTAKVLGIDEREFLSYSPDGEEKDEKIDEIVRSTTNEQKDKLVRFYYDLCNKKMLEYAEQFAAVLFDYKDTPAYSEGLMYNFEVEEALYAVAASDSYIGPEETIEEIERYSEFFMREGVKFTCIVNKDDFYYDEENLDYDDENYEESEVLWKDRLSHHPMISYEDMKTKYKGMVI